MKHIRQHRFRPNVLSREKRPTAAFNLNHSGFAWPNLTDARRRVAGFLLFPVFVILAACSSLTVQQGPALDTAAPWVLLPIANNSDSAQAAEKLEAMLSTLLRTHGISKLSFYSPPAESVATIPVLDDTVRFERALAWARSRDFKYGITGSIQEWHYKSSVEREPAVGLTLRVLNISTGEVLWSASGARSGWGRDTLSGTALDLAGNMLDTVHFRSSGAR
jgi:polysaccharide biosynthesis protein PelC